MSSSIASAYSLGRYVPVHKRSSASSSRSSSPSSSLLSPSPLPTPMPAVYTPADLLMLSDSPLSKLSADLMDTRIRAIAPEVLQTRRQRKALAWHARQHRRTPSRGSHTSEEEEDRALSWRKV